MDKSPQIVENPADQFWAGLFRRRYLVGLFYVLVILVGVTAWVRIPVELTPDLQLPSVTVTHSWGRTSPLVVEQEITRRVETVATNLKDVTRIQSTTSEGSSSVTIEFAKNAPVDFRIIELREQLLLLRDQWPANVGYANVSKRVPQELQNLTTFITYSLSGLRDSYELSEVAERQIKRKLLGMPGLADIDLSGAREPAIVLEFDQSIVENLNITPNLVASQVRERLGRRTAGWISEADGRIGLFAPPQINSVQDIRQLPILVPKTSRQVRVGDVAEVSIQDRPEKTIRRINGNTAITIFFVKETGADALVLADQIRSQMNEIARNLPSDVVLRLENDSTEDLRKQLAGLRSDALLSLAVVFLCLLIFIRRIRAPILILLCIIFSLLMGVMCLYMMDITLNVITLAALTISLGMLVDNAIVVYEQLNVRRPTAKSERIEFYSRELKRSIVPILGSTLTTVAIFIPLLFSYENLRIYLIPLGIGVSVTLLASVIISLTWMPYAMIWLVPTRTKERNGRKFSAPSWWRPKRWLMRFMILRHRLRWVLYIGLVLLIGIPTYLWKEQRNISGFAAAQTAPADSSWWGLAKKAYFVNRDKIDPWIGGLGYRFYKNTYFGEPFNRQYRENIHVRVSTPLGTPIEELNKIAMSFEEVAKNFEHALDYYETNISEYSGTTMTFFFKEPYLYRREPYVMKGEMMYLAAYTGNSGISVSGFGDGYYSGGGSSIASFSIQVKGYSLEEIDRVAEDIRQRLQQNRRVQNIELNRSYSSMQRLWHFVLNFDDTELYLKNLNRRSVIAALQLDMNPLNSQFGYVELDGKRHYLITRYKTGARYQEQFGERVRRVGNKFLKVDEVADLDKEEVMARIVKENQAYSKLVSFEYLGSYRNGADFMNALLEELPVPVGITVGKPSYNFNMGGSDGALNQTMTIFMAIFCVWMVVSALLESWSASWAVLLAIPLSALGIMYGVMEHDISFGRGAMSGALLCVGVVVNNSILLMHRRLEARRAGVNGLRAWLHVYGEKTRSVFLTSVTTIGGLLPLILFGGSDYWRDMAIVICWGLGVSVVLVLLLVGMWEGLVSRDLKK